MTPLKRSAALFALLLGPAAAGTVTTSATEPTSDLIFSSPSGSTDTALFDEDANPNHGRGNLFSLADGPGTNFEITSITLKKSTDQSFSNDTLTLRIFEGSEAQWNTGTGHSTATNGSNYYAGTTVTPLHNETFLLNGTITDNHYVTFTLSTPILVNENSDFGFLMTYDRSDAANPDRFRHREADNAGGRISVTTTSHGTSSSRRVVSFVQGTASGSSTVTTSPSAPSTEILATKALGPTGTQLFSIGANANHARGQLFSLGGSPGTTFQINAITIQKNTAQSFLNDIITLRIFEGSQAQWNSGTGRIASNPDFYSGTNVTPLRSETFTLNGTLAAQEFITFPLSTPLIVSENSDFGFFLTYDPVDGAETSFTHLEAENGGRISISDTSHGTSTRSMNHFILGSAITPPAFLTLAGPFADNMVLQRGKPIKIWGNTNPSTSVSVSIAGATASGTSATDGSWSLELPALSPGGPHTLIANTDTHSVTLSNVLIGDVWLTFGQSNMVRPLSEMTGKQFYIDEIESNNAPIRCLKVTQFGALTPQEEATVPAGHSVSGGMNWLSPSSSETWTSIGTVFAHQMYQATGVPTAIVWAAWGSSSIEGWLPAELATQFPHFAEMLPDYYSISDAGTLSSYASDNGFATNTAALTSLFSSGWSATTPDIFVRTRSNVIYNQMIHPLRHLGISGFVWYQGEANASEITNVATYRYTLPAMITEYRKRFDQGDLPFLGVQFPSHDEATWPWFREVQSEIEKLPNAYPAITIDTGLANNIHPFDKEPIGIRLALLARKYQQGENIQAHGPRFSSMSVSGNQATLTFTNATGMNSNTSPALFQIAGPGNNPTFHAANSISITGNQITISSSSVASPSEVRYAWIPVPNALTTLKNSDGLPAAPFRTDSFALPGLAAHAPEASHDSYQIARDQSLTIPAPGILANDFDLNQDALSISLLTNVNHGTLALQADGSFTYTPDQGYAGPDNFTYRNNDGALNSPIATVSLNVTGLSTHYYTWRSTISWHPSDNETTLGDPDQDGITNFLEFALGLDPLSSDSSGLPTLSQSGNDFSYHFNNPQAGLTYEVQTSTDLQNWSDPAIATLTSDDPTPVVIPASAAAGAKLFIRLRISE